MPISKGHIKCARCGQFVAAGEAYFWSNVNGGKGYHTKDAVTGKCKLGVTTLPVKKSKAFKAMAASTPSFTDALKASPLKGTSGTWIPAVATVDPVSAIEVEPSAAIDGGAITGTGGPEAIEKGRYREVMAAVTSLYVLQEVQAAITARGLTGLRVDHFKAFKADYETTLARNLFDYLTVACVGELRHAKWLHFPDGPPASRSDAYRKSLAYDPRTILPTAAKAFNKGPWGGSYGGKKWGKIAESAALFFKFAAHPLVFADHVVDLAHNGGVAFDKGYLVHLSACSKDTYLAMLDRKKSHGLLDWHGHTLFVESDVWEACQPLLDALRPRYEYRMDMDREAAYERWDAMCPGSPPDPRRRDAWEMWRAEYREWKSKGAELGFYPGEKGLTSFVKVADGLRVTANIEVKPSKSIPALAWGTRGFSFAPSASKSAPATPATPPSPETYPEPRKDKVAA